MSLLIQTILIGVVALIINIFSSVIAGWIVWGGYLMFSIALFFKGRGYRKSLLRGEQSDITGAAILPPATITVIVILIIFLFIEISKFHLLWIAPLAILIFEVLIGKIMWRSFESKIKDYKQNN